MLSHGKNFPQIRTIEEQIVPSAVEIQKEKRLVNTQFSNILNSCFLKKPKTPNRQIRKKKKVHFPSSQSGDFNWHKSNNKYKAASKEGAIGEKTTVAYVSFIKSSTLLIEMTLPKTKIDRVMSRLTTPICPFADN